MIKGNAVVKDVEKAYKAQIKALKDKIKTLEEIIKILNG